jgi:hypothetical protein
MGRARMDTVQRTVVVVRTSDDDHVRSQELDSMMILHLHYLLHSHELTRLRIKLVPTLPKTALR